jgi:hypothetical protein
MSSAAENIVDLHPAKPRKLNHRQRAALDMDMSTQFSPEQIADRLQITVGTLRKWQRLPEWKAEYDAKYQRIMERRAELLKPHEQKFDEHIGKVLELQGKIIEKASAIVEGEEVEMRDLKDASAIVESVYAHDPRRRYTKTTRQETNATHEHRLKSDEIREVTEIGHEMRKKGVIHLLRSEAIPVTAEVIGDDDEEQEGDDGSDADDL